MYQIKKDSTSYPLIFFMVDSSDHITGKIGLVPTVTISKVGSAFISPSGTISEIANGWYKVAGNATDTNTLGPLLLHATATGSDPTDLLYEIVAFDPQDAIRQGLAALPNAIPSTLGGLGTVDVNNHIAGIQGTKNTFDSLNDISASQVNNEVDTALIDIDLDHLSKVGVAPMPIIGSNLDRIMNKNASQTYSQPTDSLEAIAESALTKQKVRDAMALATIELADNGSIDEKLNTNKGYLIELEGESDFMYASDKYAIDYDFSTYSKAVILFYDQDRPFVGNPNYWCYCYTDTGSKPSNTGEIAKRDRLKDWTLEQPV